MNLLLITYVTIVTPSQLFYQQLHDQMQFHVHLKQWSPKLGAGYALIATKTDATNIEKGALNEIADNAIEMKLPNGIHNGGIFTDLQKKLFLHHHSAGKKNRQRTEKETKPLFDEMTWLRQQHKSILGYCNFFCN